MNLNMNTARGFKENVVGRQIWYPQATGRRGCDTRNGRRQVSWWRPHDSNEKVEEEDDVSIEDVANKEGIIVHELSKDENYEENPSAIDKVNIAETPEINNPPVSNNPYP